MVFRYLAQTQYFTIKAITNTHNIRWNTIFFFNTIKNVAARCVCKSTNISTEFFFIPII